MQTCTICKEYYPGMLVHTSNTNCICKQCFNEKGVHHFSSLNNMDSGEQSTILQNLTQVEEMLIARVNPILQVMPMLVVASINTMATLLASHKT